MYGITVYGVIQSLRMSTVLTEQRGVPCSSPHHDKGPATQRPCDSEKFEPFRGHIYIYIYKGHEMSHESSMCNAAFRSM